MPRILIIEDEAELLDGLKVNLKREGHEVLAASEGNTGMDLAIKESPDLILLDLMLPDTDGLSICKELRRKGLETPIIILTAKGEEIDRVVGLEVGADDYVTKPFSVRELLARIKVQLRHRVNNSNVSNGVKRYNFGDVQLDFEKYKAQKADSELELTSKEFEIMRLLIRHRGDLVTREKMLDEIWGYESFPTTRTVDNHILKLRKKLEDDPSNPEYILSVYGEGYRFVG